MSLITIKGPSLETVKGLWRPVFGGAVVGAYVVATFVDEAAAQLLQPLAAGVLSFYFLERAITHARNGN